MKILVIDNYDSFTYNLVQMIEQITDAEIDVVRNDVIQLDRVADYDRIVLSPGPGIPSEAGLLLDVIRTYAPTKSILGVCLGQQAIAEVFGGKIINLSEIYHGVATEARTIKPAAKLLKGLPSEFAVGRYHSWVVECDSLPDVLEITSVDEQGMIMSLQHKEYDVHAVQYHPESILTPCGHHIMRNFLLP